MIQDKEKNMSLLKSGSIEYLQNALRDAFRRNSRDLAVEYLSIFFDLGEQEIRFGVNWGIDHLPTQEKIDYLVSEFQNIKDKRNLGIKWWPHELGCQYPKAEKGFYLIQDELNQSIGYIVFDLRHQKVSLDQILVSGTAKCICNIERSKVILNLEYSPYTSLSLQGIGGRVINPDWFPAMQPYEPIECFMETLLDDAFQISDRNGKINVSTRPFWIVREIRQIVRILGEARTFHSYERNL